jgi:hypothetical protein
MFPFRFDKIIGEIKDRHSYYKNNPFDDRIKIDEDFKAQLESDGWSYQKHIIGTNLDYNEFVYFYDFVKDSLFNTANFEENATSYYFTKKDVKNNYNIKIKDKEIFKLNLTSISLRIFDTGIGILSFEVENDKYKDFDDILLINEYGRRVYPQFLGDNFNLEDVQNSFLAEELAVDGITENFKNDYKRYEIKFAKFITEILGNNFIKKYLIQPLLDDRMFVVCWYGNDCFSNKLKNIDINNFYNNIKKLNSKTIEDDKIEYYDNWYKFVFIDKDKMVQNKTMQENLITKSTYTRWQNYGTLYGVTRYSFVCLTDNSDFSKNIILNHIKTMYFQIITLLLAQRGSIIRFSDEITAISDINEKDDNQISDKISNLYKNYLRFKNKLYFKEITAQEQGIELYDQAREIMRVDSDINDLSNEIMALNSYAYLLEEKDEKKQMNKLTKLGTYLLPSTLVVGFFGMNVFGGKSMHVDNLQWLFIAIISLPISTVIIWFLLNHSRVQNDK